MPGASFNALSCTPLEVLTKYLPRKFYLLKLDWFRICGKPIIIREANHSQGRKNSTI